MAARRAITLALPASDPRSARVWAYLEALDPEADSSAELRQLLCEALDQAARLASIEAKIDALLAGRSTPPVAPAVDAATVGALLDFG